MIFTEKDKAFVKIFVPYYIDYGLSKVVREFPGKRRNTFGLENLITKLLKKWMSKCTDGVAYRQMCVSLTSDAIGYSD